MASRWNLPMHTSRAASLLLALLSMWGAAAHAASPQPAGACPAIPLAGAAAAAPVGVKPEDVMGTLEKLGELKSKGILTQEEFDAKKAELLKKLV